MHESFNRELAQGTYPPLLLSAAYVLDFTIIHPFRDGNGRMSRLITGNRRDARISREAIVRRMCALTGACPVV